MQLTVNSSYLQNKTLDISRNDRVGSRAKGSFAKGSNQEVCKQADVLTPEDEMESFKNEFYRELSQIKADSSVSNMAINISEEAFKKMKEDPEYKVKILNLVKRDWGSSYAPRNCSVLITVGSTLEEYGGDSWPVIADSEFNICSQNSFYKKSYSAKTKSKQALEDFNKKMEEKLFMRELIKNKTDKTDEFNSLIKSKAEKAYE